MPNGRGLEPRRGQDPKTGAGSATGRTGQTGSVAAAGWSHARTADNLSRDMTPIYLPIKVSIVEQLLCNGCVAAHSSLTFGPNLAISVRSVP